MKTGFKNTMFHIIRKNVKKKIYYLIYPINLIISITIPVSCGNIYIPWEAMHIKI